MYQADDGIVTLVVCKAKYAHWMHAQLGLGPLSQWYTASVSDTVLSEMVEMSMSPEDMVQTNVGMRLWGIR